MIKTKLMETYLIDFGKNANGGRYTLLQAKNDTDAFFAADEIGCPEKYVKINDIKDASWDCIEVEEPKEIYAGRKMSELSWKNWKSKSAIK